MSPGMNDEFHVYDTTLRDGAQREGLSLSVLDKLLIARHLDELGVGFIEGGWPGANPKDTEFFRRAQTELQLQNATLAAFGATRRPGGRAADDPLVGALRESGAPVVCLVAKSHVDHVERALRTTREENLEMLRDTITHLRAEGQRVFVDAEHFFDGYRTDPSYAVDMVKVAADAGADVVVLCDTNGGMLPDHLADVVSTVLGDAQARLGIHCHNDAACAVANTLAAVGAGVTHVQGTANGYGERCGNADLFSVVANLEQMFGRASIELKGRELGLDLSGNNELLGRIVDRVKDLEARGYSFEAADASFELLLRGEVAGEQTKFFDVESWRVIVEQRDDGTHACEATVKLHAGDKRIVETGEGNGPVNALDRALRLALERLYPELATLELVDYKVRILEGAHGTGAVTRVLVETSDGEREWSTVGVNENVIAASWDALVDAVTYGLLRHPG